MNSGVWLLCPYTNLYNALCMLFFDRVEFIEEKYLILYIFEDYSQQKFPNMRKKSGFTFVEQAIVLVPEFEMVVHKLEQQVTLRGQSRSTLQNYIRRIALFVIHFGKLPEKIDPEEINEYLAALARDPRSPSRSSFKHMV